VINWCIVTDCFIWYTAFFHASIYSSIHDVFFATGDYMFHLLVGDLIADAYKVVAEL